VAVTGTWDALVALNAAMFPVLVVANPIDGVLFVQV
jgi:hypothetical protein